jgi:hypothetical protein
MIDNRKLTRTEYGMSINIPAISPIMALNTIDYTIKQLRLSRTNCGINYIQLLTDVL